MGTNIRPKISEKNKYWVDRHRYYELKHFCLQYLDWKKAYCAIDSLSKRPQHLAPAKMQGYISDPTEKAAQAKLYYADRMSMVEKAATDADPELSSYILRGVTEELSYDYMKTNLNIPCSKDTYYNRYRRFFWYLSRYRG